MIDLIGRFQRLVMVMKKGPDNQLSMLLTMNKYWEQTLYNWFNNIDNVLNSNKFFCCLGTVIWRYKHIQMLVCLQTLNNITAHKLLKTHCEIPSNSYHY